MLYLFVGSVCILNNTQNDHAYTRCLYLIISVGCSYVLSFTKPLWINANRCKDLAELLRLYLINITYFSWLISWK